MLNEWVLELKGNSEIDPEAGISKDFKTAIITRFCEGKVNILEMSGKIETLKRKIETRRKN